jgi:riboflavin synthase
VFTGIIEELGVVETLEDQGDAVRLTVRGPHVTVDARPGDSIAVNGCCLTVAQRDGETFTADVMRETLDKTSLGALQAGARVNLERAVTPTTRLGGHIVQGHVDGTGALLTRTPSEHWELVEISLPEELARYLVDKGSVTVDGVSLTVVSTSSTGRGVSTGSTGRGVSTGSTRRGETGRASFTVSLIPETLARTTLGLKQVGDPVNLEVDVIAKYVERLLTHPADGDRS